MKRMERIRVNHREVETFCSKDRTVSNRWKGEGEIYTHDTRSFSNENIYRVTSRVTRPVQRNTYLDRFRKLLRWTSRKL